MKGTHVPHTLSNTVNQLGGIDLLVDVLLRILQQFIYDAICRAW